MDRLHALETPAPPGRPTLLLLHGAGGDHTVWGAQVSALRRTAGLRVPDLPAHGLSPGPPAPDIAALAAVTAAWAASRTVSAPIVIGHSMGGAVALQMALSGGPPPGRPPAGLILVGTSAQLLVNSRIFELVEADPPAALRRIARWAYADGAGEEMIQRGIAHLSRCEPAVLLNDFRSCNAFDVRDRLGEIRCPVLVLCGGADRLTFPAQAEWMAARIPGAEFRMLPGAGHLVMIERADEVNEIVASWIASRFPAAAAP
jgi:pimeloyl-ACP methyl ester carboxylesterase